MNLYDKDFYAWLLHNAALIREGKLAEVDLEHVAQELESISNNYRREFSHHVSLVMSHLLNPARSEKVELLIEEERICINRLLEESPSLKDIFGSISSYAYELAVLNAAMEAKVDKSTFPTTCTFSLEDCINQEFIK